MGNLDENRSPESFPSWRDLDHPAGKSFSLHEGGWEGHLGERLVAAVDPGRLLDCTRGDHHPHAPVSVNPELNIFDAAISHLCPVMAPPRASTRKLTRKPALLEGRVPCVSLIIGSGYSGILKHR